MKNNWWDIWASKDVACNVSNIGKQLLSFLFAIVLSLPPFTFQILPSYADTKNKKISYKETRDRKHGQNKSNLKNQVVTSGLVLNLDASNIDNMSTAASNLTTATTWTDLSGNSNNGTLNNFTLPTSTTMSGWDRANTLPSYSPPVLKFDGVNDYVDVGTGLNQSGSFSVGTWFKTASNGKVIIDKNGLTTTNYRLQVGSVASAGTANKLCFRVYFSVSGSIALTTAASVNDNAWHHALAVYDSSSNQLYLYLDGVLAVGPTAGGTGTLGSAGDKTFLGVRGNGTSPDDSYWNGSIANVRIYNTALTADQVRQNYNAEVSNFPNIVPSSPVISSATLNGNSISTTSPYRITNDQALALSFSSQDVYPNNKTTLSCNPSAGIFSSSPGFNSTANLAFTPNATHVGMTYSYTVSAASDSGESALSNLTFSVIVTCGSDIGCPSGQVCRQNTCCLPCPYNSNICDDGGISAAYPTPVLNLDATNIDNANTPASSSTSTTTWTNLSGNGNNGALNNFTLPTGGSASGWDGTNSASNPSVLKFDGTDDYVETNYIFPTSDFSYAFWAKSASSGIMNRPFGNADDTVGLSGTGVIWGFSGATNLYVINRQGANTGTYDINVAAPGIASGWHHVVVTVSSTGGATLYWDGTRLGGNSLATSITNSLTTRVGRNGNGTSAFNGSIANIRIYSSVLSPFQIYQNYLTESSRFGVTATAPPAFRCNASLVPLPPPFTPALTSQLSSTSTPINTSTPTPTPTPVQNITNTNSGNTTSSQGATVSSPSINTAPASTNTNVPRPFIDVSMHGVVQPETPKTTGIDLSVLKNNPPKVNPDFASPYIDVSKDGKQ